MRSEVRIARGNEIPALEDRPVERDDGRFQEPGGDPLPRRRQHMAYSMHGPGSSNAAEVMMIASPEASSAARSGVRSTAPAPLSSIPANSSLRQRQSNDTQKARWQSPARKVPNLRQTFRSPRVAPRAAPQRPRRACSSETHSLPHVAHGTAAPPPSSLAPWLDTVDGHWVARGSPGRMPQPGPSRPGVPCAWGASPRGWADV